MNLGTFYFDFYDTLSYACMLCLYFVLVFCNRILCLYYYLLVTEADQQKKAKPSVHFIFRSFPPFFLPFLDLHFFLFQSICNTCLPPWFVLVDHQTPLSCWFTFDQILFDLSNGSLKCFLLCFGSLSCGCSQLALETFVLCIICVLKFIVWSEKLPPSVPSH